MDKQLKGYLIDPEKRTITEVIYSGDYRQIYEFIGASPFDVVQIDPFNCVFVDDEGLFKNPRYFFTIKGYPQPIAGKGLVLGTDKEGETIGTTLGFAKITNLIGFTELSFQGTVTEEQENVEIMPGVKGFKITNRPIFGPPNTEKDDEKI